MNILCITHADFETPGVIETWARQAEYHFTICRPYKGDSCIGYSFDMLIIMGGPQSPLQIEQYPYLQDEIELIKTAIQNDKIILGFCLGAQLIGEALGGKTARSPEKEIGVFDISLTSEGKLDPLLQTIPEQFPVIHWHNDMPGETNESVILAYSEGCPRQIVRYAKKIYGFQCHLEITLTDAEKMIAACPDDFKPSRFTQTPDELRKQDLGSINVKMTQLLDRLVKLHYPTKLPANSMP